MTQLILKAGRQPFFGADTAPMNATGAHPASRLARILQGCATLNDSNIPVYIDIIEKDKPNSSEADSGAVLYIVAVLVFYSAGIVTMIIKYLRREKRELEEERILEDFFRSMPAYKKEREQNHVNRIAIHAFHALTSFSYDDVDDDEVSTDDDEARILKNRTETIHEVESEHSNKIMEDVRVNDDTDIDVDCNSISDEDNAFASNINGVSDETIV